MKEKFGFKLLTTNEFEAWITQQNVARTVLFIQEHHTFVPNYLHFKNDNHFDLQKGMQHFHQSVNGWLDIAQHFSIFPDGMVVTGRNLEIAPACIYRFNAHSICIENVGNFDADGDQMRPEQREAIVRVTAALCKRFNVPVNTDRIVYHHWFDLKTGARTNGSGATKTCPGTTHFFGGNTVENARQHFLPLVDAVVKGGPVPPPPAKILQYGYVTSDWLNIRNLPSPNGRKMNATPFGSVLRIYEEKAGWYRISATKAEWVSVKYVKPVQRATVNTDALNVRSGPGPAFNKVAKLAKGEEVFIFEESNNWAKINLDERWVSKNFLTLA
ncbi:MAG: amidase [Saprospirales bacterium]|nr:amidase [Saprospirales bacterium]